jgi:Secretion system C-terminal sorting domain
LKTRRILIFLTIFFREIICFGQSIEWERNYPPPAGVGSATIHRLHSLSDTGFISCGAILASDYFPEIVFFDTAGILTKRIPFRFNDTARGYAYDLVNIPNSDEFYFLGHSVALNYSRDFVCRLTSNGDTVWCNKYYYPGSLYRTISKGVSFPDKSLITVGFRQYQTTFLDLFIRKIDSLGATVFEKNYPLPGIQKANSVIDRFDGSILISGQNDDDHLLSIFDLSGDFVWDTIIDFMSGTFGFNSIINYPDLSVQMAAWNLISFPNYNSKLLRFNRNLTFDWTISEPTGSLGLATNTDSSLLRGSYGLGPTFPLAFSEGDGLSNLWTLNFPLANNPRGISETLLIGSNEGILYGYQDNGTNLGYWISKISGVGEPWVPDPCQLSPAAPGFSWIYDVGILICDDTSFSGLQYHDSVYSYEWFTSNGFSSDSSKLYAIWDTATEPTIDVTLIIENFYQCKDTLTLTLNKYVNGISSLIHDEISFNLYPNPVGDRLTIESISKETQMLLGRIDLYDLNGREVLHSQIRKQKEDLDLSFLSPGIYFARIEVNGVVERFKVIKN